MKICTQLVLTLATLFVFRMEAAQNIVLLGKKVPNFTLSGSDGKEHNLSDYKGKYVVLEWTNPDCPFVHKFYDSNTMQALQKEETEQGVIWLRIASSAPGKEGYRTAQQLADYDLKNKVAATATLLDSKGEVGHLLGARCTPHLFIINPQAQLVYAGAIDDQPSADAEGIPRAKNYIRQALAEIRAGKPVSTPTTRPYGCGIKYAQDKWE